MLFQILFRTPFHAYVWDFQLKQHMLVLVYRKRKSDGSGYNEEVHGEKHQI